MLSQKVCRPIPVLYKLRTSSESLNYSTIHWKLRNNVDLYQKNLLLPFSEPQKVTFARTRRCFGMYSNENRNPKQRNMVTDRIQRETDQFLLSFNAESLKGVRPPVAPTKMEYCLASLLNHNTKKKKQNLLKMLKQWRIIRKFF